MDTVAFFHSLSKEHRLQLNKIRNNILLNTTDSPVQLYGELLFAIRQTFELHSTGSKILIHVEEYEDSIYIVGYSDARQVNVKWTNKNSQYVFLKHGNWASIGEKLPSYGISQHLLSIVNDETTSLHSFMKCDKVESIEKLLTLCHHLVWPAVCPLDPINVCLKVYGKDPLTFRIDPWTSPRMISVQMKDITTGFMIQNCGIFQYKIDLMDLVISSKAEWTSCVFHENDSFDVFDTFKLNVTKCNFIQTPDRPKKSSFVWSSEDSCVVHSSLLNPKSEIQWLSWKSTFDSTHDFILKVNKCTRKNIFPALYQSTENESFCIDDVSDSIEPMKCIALNILHKDILNTDDLQAFFQTTSIDQLCKLYEIETRVIWYEMIRGPMALSPRISPIENCSSPVSPFVVPSRPSTESTKIIRPVVSRKRVRLEQENDTTIIVPEQQYDDTYNHIVHDPDLYQLAYNDYDYITHENNVLEMDMTNPVPQEQPNKKRKVVPEKTRKYKKHEVPTTYYEPRYRNDGVTDIARAWATILNEHLLPQTQSVICDDEYKRILTNFEYKVRANRFAKPQKDPEAVRRDIAKKIQYIIRDFIQYDVVSHIVIDGQKVPKDMNLRIDDIFRVLNEQYGPL